MKHELESALLLFSADEQGHQSAENLENNSRAQSDKSIGRITALSWAMKRPKLPDSSRILAERG
jgi:hypothetical protein